MKASKYKGYNPPFMADDEILPFQINLRLIKNDLIQLIKTIPGERVMAPSFGIGLQMNLFELLDDGLETTIKNNISNAISEYDERIELQDIMINQPADKPNLVYITLVGKIKEIDVDLKLKFTMENQGE